MTENKIDSNKINELIEHNATAGAESLNKIMPICICIGAGIVLAGIPVIGVYLMIYLAILCPLAYIFEKKD